MDDQEIGQGVVKAQQTPSWLDFLGEEQET